MFVTAVATATAFTRAARTIVRYVGSTDIQPGAATIFFVNDSGWALTCKHVALELIAASQMVGRRAAYQQALQALPQGKKSKQLRLQLAHQHGFGPGSPLEYQASFVDCVLGPIQFDVNVHSTLDIALLHFTGYQQLLCATFPIFAKNGNDLAQGKSLCRLGFPFAEFTNFSYDPVNDEIKWTQTGNVASPSFPIEGMVTRLIADASGVVGFELSTPGIKGQSGGPAFDLDGRVWGMQSQTRHLDLDFDVDLVVPRGPKRKHIQESALFHVGNCVHVNELKLFMDLHNVSYQVG